MDSSVLIKIRCTQKSLNFIRKPPLAAGDKNATKIEWTFCDIWKGYTKTALFSCKKNGGKVVPTIIENDICVVPPEVLKQRGKFYVSVRGDKDGITLTSNTLEYEIGPSLAVGEITPSDTTSDIYNQLISLINKKADNITFNIEDSTIQLSANGVLVGDKIKVSTSSGEDISVSNVIIDNNGDLIITFNNGTQQNAGQVRGKDGVVYVPHIDEYKVLTFTIEEEAKEIPPAIDLQPSDEWSTPEENSVTPYIWKALD